MTDDRRPDRADAFHGHPDPGWSVNVVGLCHACRHRVDVLTCQAYPEGIPLRILTGDEDHRFPMPGDGGTWFELDPEATDAPQDSADDVAVICRALVAEPLLHASLGSKELFHSNLLARMVEVNPQAAMRILEPWLTPAENIEPTRVWREYKHLDLLIHFNGHAPLLIENKTFSLPDEDQLRRYAETVAPSLGGHVDLVLLSLTDPGWPDGEFAVGEDRWRWLSYGELAERITSEYWDETDFEPLIFAHESRLLGLLDRLAGAVSIKSLDEPFELPAEVREHLAKAGLADAAGKMRGHQLRRLIRERYDAEGLQPQLLEVSFTRGQPLVSAYWELANGDSVGWQLQGRQWRLAMILRSLAGRDAAAISQRAEYAAGQTGWFDFAAFFQTMGLPDGATEQRPFNHYSPDFVYRYRSLGPGASVGSLVELAVAYGRLAQDFQLA